MNETRILTKKNIVFAVLVLGAVGVIAFLGGGGGGAATGGFKISGDLLNLLTVIGGVIGIWQLVGNSLESMRSESDKRDRYHDQQIATLQTRLEAIATQLESHESILGHTGSLGEILKIKDQVSDLRAALAVSTRQGEVFLKLDRLEKELESLKAHQ